MHNVWESLWLKAGCPNAHLKITVRMMMTVVVVVVVVVDWWTVNEATSTCGRVNTVTPLSAYHTADGFEHCLCLIS